MFYNDVSSDPLLIRENRVCVHFVSSFKYGLISLYVYTNGI